MLKVGDSVLYCDLSWGPRGIAPKSGRVLALKDVSYAVSGGPHWVAEVEWTMPDRAKFRIWVALSALKKVAPRP